MNSSEAKMFIAILLTVIIVGIILFFFSISIIRQQKRNMELQKANILAEISAMEKERSRIAADLHDDIGPLLSVIKFQIDHVESPVEEEQEILRKASAQIDSLIGRMREVSNNLMPSALVRKGLLPALQEFVASIRETSAFDVRLSGEREVMLSGEKAINVYRAMQEVIHNCVKHARAKLLSIHLEQKNGILSIVCKDDGEGFDVSAKTSEGKGIGLRSLNNRMAIVNGKFVIESKPGKGTAILFEIPN